ncbi:MAG: peptidoglycan editing factor PgeF [Erysipelotrichia bacterium]|nr:peptidoglycan editing factor PgeF [Candidatus Riflebacteria bacterium]NCB37175.1 peptidoglycan editing factor PgeF [Erysipelotrichia bacterium]
MKIIEAGNILAAFSDASDGDLSLYTMADEKAASVWKELPVVGRYALSLPVYANQVHRNDVLQVKKNSSEFCAGEADGLITDCFNRPIGVFSADCLPLLIFNDQACAAIHAGWRSTHLNIAQKAVEAFSSNYKIEAAGLKALIGPCINQCCLEMGDEVYDEFVAADPDYRQFFVKKNKWHLDLRALNRFQLVKAGLKNDNIADVNLCTFCNQDEFFSFRRQKKRNGSMFSFVVRRS